MSDERTSFEELYRSTSGPLLGYLTRRAAPEDAADLLAEVYLVAWRRRAELPDGDERRLWLFGVARRLVAEHHRTAGRRADAEAEGSPGGRGGGDGGAAAAVRQALASLGELDRELVTLTTWEGLSPSEAARALGLTPGTARVRLHRARARLARQPGLRALLADGDPEEGGVVVRSAAVPAG